MQPLSHVKSGKNKQLSVITRRIIRGDLLLSGILQKLERSAHRVVSNSPDLSGNQKSFAAVPVMPIKRLTGGFAGLLFLLAPALAVCQEAALDVIERAKAIRDASDHSVILKMDSPASTAPGSPELHRAVTQDRAWRDLLGEQQRGVARQPPGVRERRARVRDVESRSDALSERMLMYDQQLRSQQADRLSR